MHHLIFRWVSSFNTLGIIKHGRFKVNLNYLIHESWHQNSLLSKCHMPGKKSALIYNFFQISVIKCMFSIVFLPYLSYRADLLIVPFILSV